MACGQSTRLEQVMEMVPLQVNVHCTAVKYGRVYSNEPVVGYNHYGEGVAQLVDCCICIEMGVVSLVGQHTVVALAPLSHASHDQHHL